MSINIGDKPEQNVINVGDEITSDQLAAINATAINGTPTATNPFLTRTNTFTTADTAVRITQTGAGEAFRVEDITSPDTSPFVVTADGRVGIGTTTVGTNALAVTGTVAVTGNTAVTGNLTASGANVFTVSSGSSVPLTIQNNGTGNSFVVNDTASDASPFVIDPTGAVVIGSATPFTNAALSVNGTTILASNVGGIAAGFTVSNSSTGTNAMFNGSSATTTNPSVIISNSGLGIGLNVIQTNTSSTADVVKITNVGTGNSFVVEDSNSDASPFRISNDGTVFLGNDLKFADSTTQSTAGITNGTNVTFLGITVEDGVQDISINITPTLVSLINDIDNQLLEINSGGIYFSDLFVENSGITFADSTVQSTAAITDQSLLQSDQVKFNTVTLESPMGATIVINPSSITFDDDTVQSTAAFNPTYSASTAITINNTNYPHELTFVIGGVTYRVPARAI